MYMSSGDEQASRHTQHNHNVPMTKVQKSALAAVSSLALFGGALAVISPAPASARWAFQKSYDFSNSGNSTTCDTHSYGGGSFRTTCR